LALDTDPPPGAIQGGCTGPVYSPLGNEERFAYTVGTDSTGRVMSVGVVSRRFGPAIFILPAAKPVLKLIEMFGIIGGTPRIPVANGDLYGVHTPSGTVVLIRPGTVLPDGSGVAQEYVTLRPAAVTVWLRLMAQYGAFLWPIEASRVNGKQRFRLVADLVTSETVASLFVDPVTGRAREGGKADWEGPVGDEITTAALKALTDTAP
jgi:hypothetical protein